MLPVTMVDPDVYVNVSELKVSLTRISLIKPIRSYITLVPYTVSGVPCDESVAISNSVDPAKVDAGNVVVSDKLLCLPVLSELYTSNNGFCCTAVFCCAKLQALLLNQYVLPLLLVPLLAVTDRSCVAVIVCANCRYTICVESVSVKSSTVYILSRCSGSAVNNTVVPVVRLTPSAMYPAVPCTLENASVCVVSITSTMV